MAVNSELWVDKQYTGYRDCGAKEVFISHICLFLMSELLLDMRVSWTDITMWARNKNEHGLEEKSEAEASKEPVWTL